MINTDGVRQALATDRTVDITTTGRRSGQPRRIETWLYRAAGSLFLTGSPGKRDWYANLQADPACTLHWHISSVRQAVAPRIAERVPYVYTARYEGGERAEGVFLTSETPDIQLFPAMRLLGRERALRRWFIVGNDYVWPRRTAQAARRYAAREGMRVAGEAYLPLGTYEFGEVRRRIERSAADAVLMLLVGNHAVRFNRAFARYGLDARCLRLSTLMDENVLPAGGPAATHDLFSTAGFFAAMVTPENLDFHGRYADRFGAQAPPLGSLGESCYESVLLLAALIRQARTLDVRAIGADAGAAAAATPAREPADLSGAGARRRVRRPHPVGPLGAGVAAADPGLVPRSRTTRPAGRSPAR